LWTTEGKLEVSEEEPDREATLRAYAQGGRPPLQVIDRIQLELRQQPQARSLKLGNLYLELEIVVAWDQTAQLDRIVEQFIQFESTLLERLGRSFPAVVVQLLSLVKELRFSTQEGGVNGLTLASGLGVVELFEMLSESDRLIPAP
jgi:hypothetical protein